MKVPQQNSSIFFSDIEDHIDFVDKLILLSLDFGRAVDLVGYVERLLLLLNGIFLRREIEVGFGFVEFIEIWRVGLSAGEQRHREGGNLTVVVITVVFKEPIVDAG